MKQLVIFGSAEIAELAYYYFRNDSDYHVVAFTVDDEYINAEQLCGLPLVPFSQITERFPPEINYMHVALSYSKLNKLRQEKYEQAKKSGYTLASYICSKSVTWPDLIIGDNCMLLENQTIQPTVRIGNNVMIWSGNHLGHGSVIDDHTYIASHVVISGHCKIGKRCFLGVNSAIRDFTEIGNDSFIAMGASITKNVSDGSVVVGPQSTIYEKDDKRARMLIKKEFGV